MINVVERAKMLESLTVGDNVTVWLGRTMLYEGVVSRRTKTQFTVQPMDDSRGIRRFRVADGYLFGSGQSLSYRVERA